MSKNIKVILIAALPLQYQQVRGGVDTATLNLLDGLKKSEQVELILISFRKELKEKCIVKFSERINFYFLPFKYAQLEILDYFLNRMALKKILLEFEPDVIHIQGATPPMLRFLMLPKKNIIVTQHGVMSEEYKYVKGLKNKLKFLFKVAIERFYFPMFQNVVFISNYNKALYRGQLKAYATIYNAINSTFFETGVTATVTDLSIIYIGVINNRKNIKMLLEALYRLKVKSIIININVVGDFVDRHYKNTIYELIEKYNLFSQVNFHGWLKQDEMKSILSESSIFVLPSEQETLPVSIAEAMAMGKVVIATNVGGVAEMFEDGVSGFLIESNDINSLIGKLEFLYFNKNALLDMGIKAKLAAQKYNPTLVAATTLAFYKNVLNKTEA